MDNAIDKVESHQNEPPSITSPIKTHLMDEDEADPPSPFEIAVTPEPSSLSLPSERTAVDIAPKPKRLKKTKSSPSKKRDNEWPIYLYSPLAGTTKSVSDQLEKYAKKRYTRPDESAHLELANYGAYELEIFTFM